jgi:hypothetical protein
MGTREARNKSFRMSYEEEGIEDLWFKTATKSRVCAVWLLRPAAHGGAEAADEGYGYKCQDGCGDGYDYHRVSLGCGCNFEGTVYGAHGQV